MNKKGAQAFVFLLMIGFILPSCMMGVSAASDYTVQSADDPVSSPVIVSIKGGFGVTIEIEELEDENIINTHVSGAIAAISMNYYPQQNRAYIHITTFKLFAGTFQLYLSVDEFSWGYDCMSVFGFFVIRITPIEPQ